MNDERVQTLQKLLELDPGDSFSRYALGLEYLTSDPRRAQSLFREVLASQSDYVAAYYQLGKVSAELGETEVARETFEQGLTVAERQADWHTHGELQDALNDLD